MQSQMFFRHSLLFGLGCERTKLFRSADQLAVLFEVAETKKADERCDIVQYSIAQTTLEQVFQKLVKQPNRIKLKQILGSFFFLKISKIWTNILHKFCVLCSTISVFNFEIWIFDFVFEVERF